MTDRTNVIEAHETLMIKAYIHWSEQQCSIYWTESGCGKCYDTMDAVLDEIASRDDDLIQVVRFNDDTLIGEDITEACAAAWIAEQIGYTISDLGDIPEWVEKSEAWAEHVEAAAREAVERSDSEEHSTLDHRTQGLRRE